MWIFVIPAFSLIAGAAVGLIADLAVLIVYLVKIIRIKRAQRRMQQGY